MWRNLAEFFIKRESQNGQIRWESCFYNRWSACMGVSHVRLFISEGRKSLAMLALV